MQLCKVRRSDGAIQVGVLDEGKVYFLSFGPSSGVHCLSDLLHSDDPAQLAHDLVDRREVPLPVETVRLLAPIDQQEVWAAGVTYKRSQEARERESEGAAHFYDLVYSAARPELFFKATAARVVGPGDPVHIRRDSRWTVPEPELALVLSPDLRIVGYTIGNDMSARDIEGENPLYLPQAKLYDHACALGPVITLPGAIPNADQLRIDLRIERQGRTAFDGSTSLASMARRFEDLIDWLGRETSFPDGAILLTGTGVIPPDDFALAQGDMIHIDIAGIGRLINSAQQGGDPDQ